MFTMSVGKPKLMQKMDSEAELGSRKYTELEYKGEFYGEIQQYIGIGSWKSEHSEEEELAEGPLSSLESAAVTSLLLDALDELTILKYVIGAPEVVWNLNYRTLRERYTRRLTPVRIFPEVDNIPILTSEIKLQRDRDSIAMVLHKLVGSLEEGQTYDPLTTALTNLRAEEDDDNRLIQELKENLFYLNDLKIRVEEKRKQDEREEKERDELMYHLQDELDDVILKCEVEEKFVGKWENVRNAQNDWRLLDAENTLKRQISQFNTKSKIEKRVTHEMSLYLKIRQAELEEELEEWMSRYDSEMERRENKILHLKYERDQAEEKKHQLRQLHAERTQKMKEWVTFREIRKRRSAASLIIQSWWRGMMVRKRLGPYKPKKEKGGGGGKKKK